MHSGYVNKTKKQLCGPTISYIYICLYICSNRSGVLWMGSLRLDTCQREEKVMETLSYMAET